MSGILFSFSRNMILFFEKWCFFNFTPWNNSFSNSALLIDYIFTLWELLESFIVIDNAIIEIFSAAYFCIHSVYPQFEKKKIGDKICFSVHNGTLSIQFYASSCFFVEIWDNFRNSDEFWKNDIANVLQRLTMEVMRLNPSCWIC